MPWFRSRNLPFVENSGCTFRKAQASFIPVVATDRNRSTSPESAVTAFLLRRGPVARLMVLMAGLLLGIPNSQALNPSKRLTQFLRSQWQVQAGFPQNSVACLAQSPEGFLWIGTGDGVSRFDGANFTAFEDRSAVANRNLSIRALCAARDGSVWFGTKGGLNRIVGDRVTARYTRADGLPSEHIQALHEDVAGQLWIGSAGGVTRVDKDSFTTFTLSKDETPCSVWSIADARGGGLWLATDHGLILFDGARWLSYGEAEGMPEGDLLSVTLDAAGNPWVGSDNGFIAQFANGKFTSHRPPDGLEARSFSYMAFDRDGSLWIATYGAGVLRFREGKFESLGRAEGFARDIECVWMDARDELWIGASNNGLIQLRDAPFTPFGPPEGLSDPLTDLVFEDREGAIWVGTGEENGADRIKNGTVTHFGFREGLPSLAVLTFSDRRVGGIWIGTDHGIVSWNAGVIQPFTLPGLPPKADYFVVLEDGPDRTWYGTDLGLWERQGDTLVHHTATNGLPSDQVRSVVSDGSNGVWVGTYDGGVAHFSSNRVWRTWSTRDGLGGNFIRSLLRDTDGTLWIGSNGGGLARLRGTNLFVFNEANGLPTDQVFQVLDDGLGNLWLPSLRGIHRVSRAQLDGVVAGQNPRVLARSFGTSHGLRSREGGGGVQPAACRARDGRLWFSGGGGVAVVDPGTVLAPPPAPRIVITQVRIDSQILPTSVPARLLPRIGNLEISYTALELSMADLVRYRFRLEGLEGDWVDPGLRKTAYYTHVAPGTYRFVVETALDGGKWGDSGAVFQLEILPHFYQTIWFQLALIATAGLLVLLSVHWRMQSLVRRRTVLAGLVAQRTRELERSVRVLEQTNAELARATRVKSEFLANMSHEIRTPLNAVLGFSQLLLASGLNRIQRDYAEHVRTSGEALLGLISDILDLTKIESGRLELESIPFDAGESVEQALEVFTLAIGEKRLELVYRPAPGSHTGFVGDPTRLRQVLINLVGNAVKFTRSGEVVVTLRSTDLPEGRRRLEFEVRDTGIGIAPDRLDRLFQPFSQVDSSNTREFGGSGLGLVISRRLVDLMGGAITVESQAGVGSIFRFTLVGGIPTSLPDPAVVTPVLEGLRALILEPNISQRERLVELARQTGLQVTAAADPSGLVGSLESAVGSADVVIAEVKSFGPALAALASATPALAGKILWLDHRQGDTTAEGLLASRPTVVKPVRATRFFEALVRVAHTPANRPGPRTPFIPLPALRILVGEDNPVNQHLAHAMLAALGQKCELLADGALLLNAIRKGDCDVVIADLQMPVLDGSEVARRVHQEMTDATRPYLITLTAAVTLADRQRCLEAGMDDFLTKPLRMATLREALARADQWLGRHRNGYGSD